MLVVTASSDGAVRLWNVCLGELIRLQNTQAHEDGHTGEKVNGVSGGIHDVGRLIGTLETGNRITCLGAFVLDGKAEAGLEDEAEVLGLDENENDSQDSDE